MATAGDVVREFCAAIDRKDLAAVESLLDGKVVYHNTVRNQRWAVKRPSLQ